MKKPSVRSTSTSISTSISILTLLLSLTSLNAQEYCEWTEPALLTDTNSVYANPYVSVYGETSWMFYEKQGETTSIYKMDLNDTSNNTVLLSGSGVNYSSPFFRGFWGSSRSGWLFYLSDQEGERNLYSSVLYNNDSLGEAFKLIENLDNLEMIDFMIPTADYSPNKLVFTLDSNVFYCNIYLSPDSVYAGNVVQIDTNGFNIQSADYLVMWQRIIDDSSLIVKSHYSYDADSGFYYWREPEYVDSTGNNTYLSTSRMSEEWGGETYHVWVKNDTVFGSDYGYDVFIMNTNSKPDVREISMVNWMMGVKMDLWDLNYLCFATGLGDDSEIFSSQEFCNENGIYITDNEIQDDNPEVYFGEFSGTGNGGSNYYVYCIWQTHINGNIALAMSKSVAEFSWSIDENKVVDDYLNVSPNPFNESLKININTHNKHAELMVLNVHGQQVAIFEDINSNSNWQSINWQTNPQNQKGIYLVVLNLEGKVFVRKVVLQ